MKIFIVSDTHGATQDFIHMAQEEKPDQVLHLGDFTRDAKKIEGALFCPVTWVKGNCDGDDFESPLERVISVGGYNIYMSHGHQHFVKQGLSLLKQMAKEHRYDIILFGHTHQRCHEIFDGTSFFNPGTFSYGQYSFGELWLHDGGFELKHREIK